MPFEVMECSACGQRKSYRCTVLAATTFENTNKPLREWLRIMHVLLTGNKGITALQICRVMGFGNCMNPDMFGVAIGAC